MIKYITHLTVALFILVSCTNLDTRAPFQVTSSVKATIQTEMLESINNTRLSNGLTVLGTDSALQTAANAHSKDMSKQNRPWHFSSDGRSPLQRVASHNYQGSFRGEVISESYENQHDTVSAWMSDPNTQAIIMDPKAKNIGIGLHQDPSGKVWWTVIFGA